MYKLNEHNIGEKVLVQNRLIVDGRLVIEYVQGILLRIDKEGVEIEQYFPFINLYSGGETIKLSRYIKFSEIQGKIEPC